MPTTELYKYNVPTIGARGHYELLAPFTLSPGEIYQCIAVRTISEYLANGEDPLTDVYLAKGLTETHYEADARVNMQIIVLQNDKGYSISVPADRFSKYPIQDGVPYRAMVIQAYLPPMPVTQDTAPLEQEIRELVLARIGVTPRISKVSTSDIRAVSIDKHETTQGSRAATVAEGGTVYATVANLQRLLDEKTARIEALEQYILDNQP